MKNSFSLNYRAWIVIRAVVKGKIVPKKKKEEEEKDEEDEVDPPPEDYPREEDDPRLKGKNYASSSWERIILACLLSSRA